MKNLFTAAAFILVLSACGDGSNPITAERLVGTWACQTGDADTTIRAIYRPDGTADWLMQSVNTEPDGRQIKTGFSMKMTYRLDASFLVQDTLSAKVEAFSIGGEAIGGEALALFDKEIQDTMLGEDRDLIIALTPEKLTLGPFENSTVCARVDQGGDQ
jgi:hypothetical protein